MPIQRAVYTVLFGGYEELNEQPIAAESNVPFICFTDDENLRSSSWEIRIVQPTFPLDLVRSQRELKILGHPSLADVDESLYVDNSVTLKVLPETILDDWLESHDFGLSQHSYRDRVIDEFDEVVALNYDEPGRVNEQLLHYAELYPDVIQQKPYWNAILARRHTDLVRQTMTLWFNHVLRFSRRDQLSINVAIASTGIEANGVPIDNWNSDIHTWPAEVNRKVTMGLRTARRTGPMLAEIARLEREAVVLRQRQESDSVESAAATAESAKLRAQLDSTVSELNNSVDEQVQLHAAIDSLRSSMSWRVTAPLRKFGTIIRRRRVTH